MKKSLLPKLFAIVAMGVISIAAQAIMPENGKIYRIINKSYGLAMTDRGPNGIVGCTELSDNAMSQRWQITASGNVFYLRSLGTGKYLNSSRIMSTGWTLVGNKAGSAAMTITATGENFIIKANGDGNNLAAHCDASHNIVCWNSDILPSQWDFEEIEMTQAEVDNALNTLADMEAEVAKEANYQTLLQAIYADEACTTLKANYQSMTDAQLETDTNYKGLSEPLKAMVRKSINGNWSESYADEDKTTEWDSQHALKYRVQLYEPYSEGNLAAQLAGIQAYTNMNNPTGIVGNTGDILYVMVDGDIKEGATLYIGSVTGYGMFNNCTEGVQLHKGLNLVPIWSDMAHQFIYYTVNTCEWQDGKSRPVLKHKVTDFDDIKIHIEGGRLNGFFNHIGDDLYAADKDADFAYTSQRAVHPMYDMMGKYVILHFFLFPTKSSADATSLSPGVLWHMDPANNPSTAQTPRSHSMEQIMKAWDDMCFRERTLIGIQSDEELNMYNQDLLWGFYEPLTGDKIDKHPAGDTWNTDPGFQYSDYFNNRMMGITMQGDLFMNATSWRTAYNITTLDAILNQIPVNSGSMWGPAHEYGHINQQPMKMAGTTEESNNIFSNIAVYYLGLNTSRSNPPIDQLRIFNQDLTYLENGVWGTTRMFLQLWLYYHACGNNKKFYPRLYELLRNNPRQQSYYLNMRYDQCHFAKMCCIAAQEDLTDYFDSWGFFVPLENYHIGDYSNFYATLTEADIKAVKEEIKALGLPKNNQIILIDDRPGVTDRASWYDDYMSIQNAGPLGGVADFRNKVKASGSMTCTMRNDSLVITMGEGANAGVGFLVYHNDGTLLGFTNDYRCPLKKAATAALMTGNAKVYAVSADGSTVEVINDYINRPISEHLSNLRKLIESCADVAGSIDDTHTYVGYYIPFFIKDFIAAYDAANNVKADATANEITEIYLNLLNAYNETKVQTIGKVAMIPSSIFKVHNNRFDDYVLSSTSKSATSKANRDEDDDYQKWELTDAGDGNYRFYNVRWQRYIGQPNMENNAYKSTAMPMVEKRTEAGLFKMIEAAPGRFLFAYNGDTGMCLHVLGEKGTGTLVLAEDYWEASKWKVEIKEAHEGYGAKVNLLELIAKATLAYEEAGSIVIDADPIVLNEDMLFSNAKSQSGEDVFTSFNVLLDNDFQTYFHTNTDNDRDSDDGEDHYLGVDLGQGNSTTSFQVSLSNRDVSRNGETDDESGTLRVNNPINMYVEGSNDGNEYTRITTLQRIPSKSGGTYVSDLLGDGNPYRYIRLVCIGSSGKAHGHYYFCLSEFGINNAEEVAKINPQYPKVTAEMMFDIRDQLEAATKASNSASTKPDVFNNAYDALLEPYITLTNAMGIENVIEEITLDTNRIASSDIYDLMGRKVAKPSKGVFIINGVKTLVR